MYIQNVQDGVDIYSQEMLAKSQDWRHRLKAGSMLFYACSAGIDTWDRRVFSGFYSPRGHDDLRSTIQYYDWLSTLRLRFSPDWSWSLVRVPAPEPWPSWYNPHGGLPDGWAEIAQDSSHNFYPWILHEEQQQYTLFEYLIGRWEHTITGIPLSLSGPAGSLA